jgi:outer membrane lipoprotein-sorting protein
MRLTSLCCRGLPGLLFCVTVVAFLATTRATADEPKPADPSASEILERMDKVYANCKSYRDSGVVKTLFIKGKSKRTVEKPFTTAFVRPDRFRFEFKEGSYKPRRYIIWFNGKDVRTWWDVGRRLEKPESLSFAVAGATGVSGGSAKTIPTLLLPDMVLGRRLTDITDPKRVENANLGKIECFRVEGMFADTPTTLWIDQKSYLVRQIDEKTTFDDFRTEDTTSYDPSIDDKITDEMLAFDAPVKI